MVPQDHTVVQVYSSPEVNELSVKLFCTPSAVNLNPGAIYQFYHSQCCYSNMKCKFTCVILDASVWQVYSSPEVNELSANPAPCHTLYDE